MQKKLLVAVQLAALPHVALSQSFEDQVTKLATQVETLNHMPFVLTPCACHENFDHWVQFQTRQHWFFRGVDDLGAAIVEESGDTDGRSDRYRYLFNSTVATCGDKAVIERERDGWFEKNTLERF